MIPANIEAAMEWLMPELRTAVFLMLENDSPMHAFTYGAKHKVTMRESRWIFLLLMAPESAEEELRDACLPILKRHFDAIERQGMS